MSQDWLAKIHNATRAMSDLGRELDELSEAFGRIGNQDVALELSYSATKIQTYAGIIDAAVGESISEQLKTAQEHSVSIIKAALAGALTGGVGYAEQS